MAKLVIRLAGRRGLVVALAVAAAVLEAKGIRVRPLGFFDGPH